MAEIPISVENLKRFWHSQVHDPDKWAFNMKFLRAAGIFAGSIVLIRNFGESVAL